MMFSLKRLSHLTSRPEQTQIALGVVAVVALIFGWWQLKTSLRLPVGSGNNSEVNMEAPVFASASQEIIALQQKDSDGDGLSDYEELYVYNSSPYLVDTDSDGYSDKTEVDSGNDPNCSPDSTCGPLIIASGENTETASTPTADEIRAMLRQAGASEDEIANYDDATLLQIYREVAGEVSPSSNNGSVTSGLNLTSEQKDLIRQMSAAELRQFLINGGADASMLNQIDDATLKAVIYQELGL